MYHKNPRANFAAVAPPEQTSNRMRNLKLVLAYDGSDFSGWQVQPNTPTIQGTLAEAIARLTGETILPQGSGRTDAGVHALAQVATFCHCIFDSGGEFQLKL